MTATYVTPWTPLKELGLTELIGVNEQVDQNEYSGSVSVSIASGPVPDRPVSGMILSVVLYSTEDGTGAVQTPAGKLLVLDADPAVSAGDTALVAAEWPTVLGIVPFVAADWRSDANGAAAMNVDVPVLFHDLLNLFFVWFHEDTTSFNDGAGDDEQLEFNCWYRRES